MYDTNSFILYKTPCRYSMCLPTLTCAPPARTEKSDRGRQTTRDFVSTFNTNASWSFGPSFMGRIRFVSSCFGSLILSTSVLPLAEKSYHLSPFAKSIFCKLCSTFNAHVWVFKNTFLKLCLLLCCFFTFTFISVVTILATSMQTIASFYNDSSLLVL